LRSWLSDKNTLSVLHNAAYDMAVVAEQFPALRDLVFQAYDEDRVTCTKLRTQLLDIAAGTLRRKHIGGGKFVAHNYDLKSVAERYAGIELQKDAWRLSYGEFIDTPLEEWPRRAVEVQAKARVKLAELRAHPDQKAVKESIQGLEDMIASAPEQCIRYPLMDAVATLAVYLKQERSSGWLKDQFRQARKYFKLHLDSAWGIRTDEKGVSVLEQQELAALEVLEAELIEAGLVRENGKKNTKAAKRRMLDICKRDGLTVPRTKSHGARCKACFGRGCKSCNGLGISGGCKKLDGTKLPPKSDECEDHVSLDSDACEASEDELLIDYAEFAQHGKVLSNDIKAFRQGLYLPIHTHYGLAATGRTTSSGPNIQNVTKRPGMRECYVARSGYVFAQCDYPTLELYALAQCCLTEFGESKLAEALLAGQDPHLWVASRVLKLAYEDALAKKKVPSVKRARQQMKAFNFGRMGGMGDQKFVDTTRRQVMAAAREEGLDPKQAWAELELDIGRSKTLNEEWKTALPEMRLWFALADARGNGPNGRGMIESLFTERFRGDCTYCQRCNTPVQGLGIDCASEAGWLIAKAQYVERCSPLFNTRTVVFAHDEFLLEVPDDHRAHDAAYELARLMVVGANKYLADVPIPLTKMEPTLMRRWSKKAEPRFDSNGRLVPWE
jgi:hypothetical protein